MPVFNKSTQEAKDFSAKPGTWLAVIPRTIKLGAKTEEGIEIGRNKNNHEMWKARIQVIADPQHPEAPDGALIYENLTWDGPQPGESPEQAQARKAGTSEGRILKLLRCMGHPVDAWRQSTAPVNITPDLMFDRPFVVKTKRKFYDHKGADGLTEKREGLETDGFMPFQPPSAPRGPAPDSGPAAGAPAATAFPYGANAAGGAQAGGAPTSPPAGKPSTKSLWG